MGKFEGAKQHVTNFFSEISRILINRRHTFEAWPVDVGNQQVLFRIENGSSSMSSVAVVGMIEIDVMASFSSSFVYASVALL